MKQAIRHGNIGIAAGAVVITLDVLLFVSPIPANPSTRQAGYLRCSLALQLA